MTPSQITGIDKPVSPFALGTAFYATDTAETWFEILDAYLAAGGTVIDSARAYGQSEEVLGRWFETRPGIRERVLLITKGGHGSDGKLPENNYANMVHDEVAASLRTLKTDTIDLYMLHRDNQEMPVRAILEPLNEEIASGRLRALGASNWEYRRVTEANEYADNHGLTGFAVVSNTISLARPAAAFYTGLVHTDPAGERWHQDTGIPLIPWSSQARGFFTGQYAPNMRDDPGLVSPDTPSFMGRMLKVYGTDDNFERLQRARDLGEQKGGYTAVEVALAWLLSKPFPIVPVVGPHTTDELASCLRARSLSLTDYEIEWLNIEEP